MAFAMAARGAPTAAWTDSSPPAARVVIAQDDRATTQFEPRPEIVEAMMDAAIRRLSGRTNLGMAWRAFVSRRDVVGLKIYSGPGPNSGTRPAVVGAVIQGLLAAGLPSTNIIVWDHRLADLRLAGYDALAQRYGVRLAGSADEGYDESSFYDSPILGSLVAGDLDFDVHHQSSGRKSYVSKLVTKEMTRIIVISPLLNHNLVGICGNLYSLAMGSIDNSLRFESDPARLAQAVPEIYALPALSDHVALCILDALIGQYQGEQMSLLHYSAELNQIWVSKDPVALDVLGIQELDRERLAVNMHSFGRNPDLYNNAALLELGTSDLSKVLLDAVK